MLRDKCLASRVVLCLTASTQLVVGVSFGQSPLDFLTPPAATKPAAPPPPQTRPATEPAYPVRPATRPVVKTRADEVNDAIKRGVEFLYSKQFEGHWENSASPDPDGKRQGTGLTALVTYALLASGERATDPRVARAVEFLQKNPAAGTYALGFRAQVWMSLPPSQQRAARPAIIADRTALTAAMRTTGPASGMFHYFADQRDTFDHSTAQIGLLGLWAIDKAGLEVDRRLWMFADAAWRKTQTPEGSWAYMPGMHPTMSMTAAGVASLFITQEKLRANLGCTGNSPDPEIERGLQWIANRFDTLFTDPTNHERIHYTLFGLSRIGIISGHKYFGKHDWFDIGSAWLLKTQKKDGSWHPPGGDAQPQDVLVATAFSLLFLARGSAPVLIQKLQYTTAAGTEGPWAQRPRDIANITAWMGREQERNFNWQSTPLEAASATLQDAPILYISGNEAPVFQPEELDRLREYVQQGGLILGHADCGSEAFANAFRKLGTDLFPDYQFRELPANHPIFTSETVQYKAHKWASRPQLEGISNGVRELMILLPSADAARAWQLNDTRQREDVFQLASNIVLYATDNRPMAKGMTHLVKPDPNKSAVHAMNVARIRHDGNWDPEPGGWRRLAAVMHNEASTTLNVIPVKLGEKQLKKHTIAHLTGTGKISFTPEQREELLDFLLAGGTLIVDAAGGSSEFSTAIEEELNKVLVAQGARLHDPIGIDHPSMEGVKEVSYRFWARTRNQLRSELPMVRGYELNGRIAVFLSTVDLSTGLVGHNVDGIAGYSPASATELMQAMLFYAVAPKNNK